MLKISDVPTDGLPPSHVTPKIILSKLFILVLSGFKWERGAEHHTVMLAFRWGKPKHNTI